MLPVSDVRLLMIVPSRGRPESLRRMAAAWHETRAFDDGAGFVFLVDEDEYEAYAAVAADLAGSVAVECAGPWRPLVPKLNRYATVAAEKHPALGFMGDDHLPRTPGWVKSVNTALALLKTGIVSGRDGWRTDDLPTYWVMTPDIVLALGAMVPGSVWHLYCDNIVRDLGRGAGCYSFLADVLVEHMHPFAGKASADAGYREVNSPERYRADRAAYHRWRASQMTHDVEIIRTLRM